MAYCSITKNRRGELVAKLQASGKDPKTGENKVYSKRVYNENQLTEAKFRRYAEKLGVEFEMEVRAAYEAGTEQIRSRIYTFSELMAEWTESIKQNLSFTYYKKAKKTGQLFNTFLEERRLAKSPVTEIKVRDVQQFLNLFSAEALGGFVAITKLPLSSKFELNFDKF